MVFQVQGGGGAHFNYGPVGVGTTSPTTQFTVATSANITETALTSGSTELGMLRLKQMLL